MDLVAPASASSSIAPRCAGNVEPRAATALVAKRCRATGAVDLHLVFLRPFHDVGRIAFLLADETFGVVDAQSTPGQEAARRGAAPGTASIMPRRVRS
jgi:hypothetical protein